MFEGIAKTNTTHTYYVDENAPREFEGIAKTNTTHTHLVYEYLAWLFEGIAKTNTTHTGIHTLRAVSRLRVLLKQIQHTHPMKTVHHDNV